MTNAQNQKIIALYEQWAKSMVYLTARRLHNMELAKDIVQEVFLLACCKADEMFSRGDNPKAWLFRTLENITMREQRKSYFLMEFLVDNIPEYLPINENGTNDMVGLAELLPGDLRDEDRTILIWRLEKQLTYEDISRRCGLSPDACRQRYSRAVQRCKKLLQNNFHELSQN